MPFILGKMGIKIPVIFVLLIWGSTMLNNVIFVGDYNITIIKMKSSWKSNHDIVLDFLPALSLQIFRVWDIQTLSLLQVFHDTQVNPEEMENSVMLFDNDRGVLISGMLLQLMYERMSILLEWDFLYDYILLKLSKEIKYIRCTEYWEVRVFAH